MSTITKITGNVTAGTFGVYAKDNLTEVTVFGTVIGSTSNARSGNGIWAHSYAKVSVLSGVTGGNSGVYA